MLQIDLIVLKKSNYLDDTCEVYKNFEIDNIHQIYLKPKKYLSSVKYVSLNGFKYYPGAFLVVNLKLDDYSSVGLIETIFSVDGKIVFYLQIYKITGKISKLNCLEIAPTNAN